LTNAWTSAHFGDAAGRLGFFGGGHGKCGVLDLLENSSEMKGRTDVSEERSALGWVFVVQSAQRSVRF
jgi:hypothetical protein